MAELSKRSGVPTPTIKHYIREGLLPGPEVRTSRNMAYYDGRVAKRIQAIKALQAEQFLPLRVIGELLEPSPSAERRSDLASQRKALTALAPAVTRTTVTRRKRTDVLKTERVSRAELDQLEKDGVIDHSGEGETAGFGGADLAIVELIGDLRRNGYGEVFPLEIAQEYLAAVRRLIEVEIDIFRRHALGRPLPVSLPDAARHAVGFGERLVVALRAKALPKVLALLTASGGAATGARGGK